MEDQTLEQAILIVSQGNIGATQVIVDLIMYSDQIDPLDPGKPFQYFGLLDKHEIAGHFIWLLFRDVCGENIIKTAAVLRALDAGIITPYDLRSAMEVRYGPPNKPLSDEHWNRIQQYLDMEHPSFAPFDKQLEKPNGDVDPAGSEGTEGTPR